MRKFLCCLAFVAISLAVLSAFAPQASAEITCVANTTPGRLLNSQVDCRSSCKAEKDANKIVGCKASCDRTYEFCSRKLEEAKKKEDAAIQKSIHCHDPVVACLVACHKTTSDKKTCDDKCAKGEAKKKFDECLKR
jgi:hypothetical protein